MEGAQHTAVRSARVVFECQAHAPEGFVFRVWTEYDGVRSAQANYATFAQGVADVMDRVAGNAFHPVEPIFEESDA